MSPTPLAREPEPPGVAEQQPMTPAGDSRRIRVLPGDVISRIAAGEVVERPAAVVKELLDNSLDAGSTTIAIDVKDGGVGLIRVVDDGEGMSRADATQAFQRHATSKLVSDRDLSSIATLGFRGEALPSIASISKVRLVTTGPDEPVGTELLLSGGAVLEVRDIAAPRGTHIEVTDLFFNTPARRKFLRTAATEFSHINHVVQQASLAWPTVQFRVRHNGQDILQFPAVALHRDRVLQVYHRRFVDQCVEVEREGPGFHLRGYTIKSIHARAGRTPQDLFVNRRPVKNATMSHALYDGYESSLAKGRYPLFVLFLDVEPDRVDVNVHPTKREVRFLEQDTIHREVRRAIRESLGIPSPPHPVSVGFPSTSPVWNKGTAPVEQRPLYLASESAGAADAPQAADVTRRYEAAAPSEVTPFGQVNRTFLVAQVGSELHVVDQHTAHERVLFERLQRVWAGQAVPSQRQLIPEPVDLPPHGAVVLNQHLSDLEKLGVLIEPFGASSFLIRAVPAILGRLDCSSLVQDLIDDLAQWNSVSSLEARVRPVFATLACHSAVRAGREMDLPEIKQLIEDWVGEGLPMTCPHGRRVALRLPTEELLKMFGRG